MPRHSYSRGAAQGVPARASLAASPSPLMDASELKAKTTTKLQVPLNAQAMGFKHSEAALTGDQCASWLVDAGNVPVVRVFNRLRSAMHPTIEDVEHALDTLELAAATTVLATAPPEMATPMECDPTPMECDPPVPLHDSADAGLVVIAQANEGETTGPDAVPVTHLPGVGTLFCTPEQAVINQLPTRRPRQRRTFDMTAVRRSARLAKKRNMPVAEKAQRNLWRKLGIQGDELAPVEEVLRDFIGMFTGPLPEHVIAAMTTIFDLDDEGADALNDALIEHAGEGLNDMVLGDSQAAA
ncbi:unnamed protein product [Urochloa humidicola]